MSSEKMNYPGATGWMWTYCTYLGPFTDTGGYKYDLGIYKDAVGGPSFAIVYGNECGDYLSGNIDGVHEFCEAQEETIRRWRGGKEE